MSVNLPLNGHFYKIWPYGSILDGIVYWSTHFFGQGTLNDCTLLFHGSLKNELCGQFGSLPTLKWEHFGIFCSKFHKIAILSEFWVCFHFNLSYFYHFIRFWAYFWPKLSFFMKNQNSWKFDISHKIHDRTLKNWKMAKKGILSP